MKEALRYQQALRLEHALVKESGLITGNALIDIQAELEQNRAGLRKLPGTALKNAASGAAMTTSIRR